MKLSIITINYNNASGLKKTMESVLNQTWEDFEYIVIDGNSNDESISVIKSFESFRLKWVSEPDTGIYNAMNKGIQKANGDYILFLNSGDYLYNRDVLLNAKEYFLSNVSFLSGHLFYKKGDDEIIRKHPDELSFSYLASKSISHPSTFIKREMFTKYDLYNEANKIVSDWEFFFKTIGINGESFLSIDEIITIYDLNGISSKEENLKNIEEERTQVFKKYLKPIFNDEFDTFLFQNFIAPSKRIKYLKYIEKSLFFRKVTTVLLSAINFFIKK